MFASSLYAKCGRPELLTPPARSSTRWTGLSCQFYRGGNWKPNLVQLRSPCSLHTGRLQMFSPLTPGCASTFVEQGRNVTLHVLIFFFFFCNSGWLLYCEWHRTRRKRTCFLASTTGPEKGRWDISAGSLPGPVWSSGQAFYYDATIQLFWGLWKLTQAQNTRQAFVSEERRKDSHFSSAGCFLLCEPSCPASPWCVSSPRLSCDLRARLHNFPTAGTEGEVWVLSGMFPVTPGGSHVQRMDWKRQQLVWLLACFPMTLNLRVPGSEDKEVIGGEAKADLSICTIN